MDVQTNDGAFDETPIGIRTSHKPVLEFKLAVRVYCMLLIYNMYSIRIVSLVFFLFVYKAFA